MNLRGLAGNLAALVVAGVLSAGAAELVLRPFVARPLPRTLPEVRYAPHPVRRFTLAPDQSGFSYGVPASVDARGFRRNGSGTPAAGAPTVLALGDSFTFGMGVRDDDTWPARLEAALRGRLAPPPAVVNAGTISYGVFQELDLLRSAGLALQPRVVIHALYWNDFMSAEPPPPGAPPVVTPAGYLAWDGLEQQRSGPERVLSWLVSNSALVFGTRQIVAAAMSGRQERPAAGGGPVSYGAAYAAFLERGLTDADWQPIEAFYRDLTQLGREHGFATFVVIMPVNDIVGRPDPASHPYPVAARRRLEALGIPYLDTFEVWAAGGHGAGPFLPQGADAHLNADGYRLVVEALTPKLLADPAVRAALAGDGRR